METDVYTALEEGNVHLQKQCEEELFALEHKLKSSMDAGVSADDYPKYQALLEAVYAAREVFNKLSER
jgi:hypothetical protein